MNWNFFFPFFFLVAIEYKRTDSDYMGGVKKGGSFPDDTYPLQARLTKMRDHTLKGKKKSNNTGIHTLSKDQRGRKCVEEKRIKLVEYSVFLYDVSVVFGGGLKSYFRPKGK